METCIATRNPAPAGALSAQALAAENDVFRGKGGTSAETADYGFRPGFLDTETNTIYPSRFSDGTPAPLHLLDGLPNHLVAARDANGRVARLKHSIVSGFVRCGAFYTRAEAARCLSVAADAAALA